MMKANQRDLNQRCFKLHPKSTIVRIMDVSLPCTIALGSETSIQFPEAKVCRRFLSGAKLSSSFRALEGANQILRMSKA